MINSIRKQHSNILTVDAGDVLGGKDPEITGQGIFAAMDLMQYDAVNVGEDDFISGIDFLKELASKVSFDLVSANIVSAKDGAYLFKPYVIKTIGDIRVGIIGVVAPNYFTKGLLEDNNIKIESYIRALNQLIPQVREKADFVVLLAHLGHKGVANLLRFNNITDIDVVVTGHESKYLEILKKENETILLEPGNKGQYLGKLTLDLADDQQILDSQVELIHLVQHNPVDQRVERIVYQVMTEISDQKKLESNEKKRMDFLNQPMDEILEDLKAMEAEKQKTP